MREDQNRTVDDAPSSSENDDTETRAGKMTTRRKVLATGAATWATVGLAGCTGGDTDTTTEEQETTEGPGQTETENGPEDFIVSTNTYWNGHPAPEGTGGYVGTCSPERQFRRDMDVTFVIGVWDSATGAAVTDDVVDSVTVSFPDRPYDDVELEFVPAEEEGDKPQWNGTFDIPDDAETGSVSYEVQVSDDDANFYEVGIAAASFSIIDPEPMGETSYVVTTETFWNGHPAPDGTNGFVGACSPERQFRPSEMNVTFVIGIYNGVTGEFVGADAVDGVSVTFPDTDQIEPVSLTYQPGEEENTEEQWHGTLDLTADTPAGTYTFEVTVEGAENEILDVGVASDKFNVLEE